MSSVIEWEGPNRQPCPDCARSPKDRTCGVTVEQDDRGVAHCFRCGYVETRRGGSDSARRGIALRPRVVPKHEVLSAYGLELFGSCVPLSGTVGEAYLLARDCVIPPADGDLRFHPRLQHPASDHNGPALVALGTDVETGQPLTAHRTWVCEDGSKASVEPPRMLLGGHRKKGAVVRLWPDEAVTTGLGIAEGIETALSLAHAYSPVWACIDAGNMAAMPTLQGIETLVIGADHDEAGIKAATACADRWTAESVDVRVIAPETARSDWNDARVCA